MSITSVATGQFILVCWAIFLLFWLITALSVKPTMEKRPVIGKEILLGIVVFLLMLFVLRLAVPGVLGATLWSYSTTSGIIADVIVFAGLCVLLWSRVMLGRNWSAGLVLKQEHALIQTGPYAYVRHPIYSGLYLMIFGEACWYGTVPWFVFFLAVVVGMWMKAMREEKLLTEHFPIAYPAYKKRTKAMIPFVL